MSGINLPQSNINANNLTSTLFFQRVLLFVKIPVQKIIVNKFLLFCQSLLLLRDEYIM